MEALKEKPVRQRGRMRMDNWNDDRLGELSRRMDDGFKEMRDGFARIDQRFEQIDQRFEKVVGREEMKELIASINGRSDRTEERVDRLYYGCVALLVLLIGNSVVSTWL
jgi:hypothetical protein